MLSSSFRDFCTTVYKPYRLRRGRRGPEQERVQTESEFYLSALERDAVHSTDPYVRRLDSGKQVGLGLLPNSRVALQSVSRDLTDL